MKRGSALLLVASVAVALLLAEIGAQVYVFWRQGSAFWNVSDHPKPAVRSTDLFQDVPLVHPYFGFANRPGHGVLEGPSQFRLGALPDLKDRRAWQDLEANNHGFFSPHDYPYVGTPQKDYVIGVFGGSVAVYFAVVGADRLIERLEDQPFIAGRNIVVLNFAQSGYKQPQQAIVLAYFLSLGQHLDVAINIDGFNEAALSFRENWKHGVDVSLPRGYPGGLSARLANLTDEQIDWQARLVSLRRWSSRTTTLMDATPSAFVYLACQTLETLLRGAMNQHLAERPTSRSRDAFFAPPPLDRHDASAAIERIAENWEASSRLIHRLTEPAGVHYIHLLQPSQYWSTRRFGAAERRVALSERQPYAEPVRSIYPRLASRLENLRRDGITAIDGTSLFDAEPSPVYVDNCCHYTKRGNEIVADVIADHLIALQGERQAAAARPGAEAPSPAP
jgi:hypothetical protein